MLKNILLLLCFALPVSQQARDFLYIVKAATVEYVAPTEDVLLASNSVVGIETLSGLGSATYIGGGLFLSAHHVVEGNEDQPLLIQDWHLGLAYRGFVVAYDLDSDLVIIGTNDPVLTPLQNLLGATLPLVTEYTVLDLECHTATRSRAVSVASGAGW